jgi:hypothetical protein
MSPVLIYVIVLRNTLSTENEKQGPLASEFLSHSFYIYRLQLMA